MFLNAVLHCIVSLSFFVKLTELMHTRCTLVQTTEFAIRVKQDIFVSLDILHQFSQFIEKEQTHREFGSRDYNMQVVESCSAYLSNYEVLDLLQNVESNEKSKNLATITYLASKYLEDTPCTKQSPEKIKKFLEAIGSFNLTKCEKLTLLNLCPTTPLEIQLIIEDSEDRLSEEDVEAVLQIIANLRDQQDTEQT